MPSEIQSQKYEKALHYEIFVKEEYGFAKNEIQSAKCIFDIGGHIGYFSQWCKILNSNAEIHYFEPIKKLYNEARNNLINQSNIILNNYGIGAKKEIGKIFFENEKTMQSSKYHSFLNSSTNKIDVRFDILKNYIINNDIKKIDVLKLDVEGMEFEIFNSRSDFEREKIQTFTAEIHILNDDMEGKWNLTLQTINNNFNKINIFKSGYCKEIFTIYAMK